MIAYRAALVNRLPSDFCRPVIAPSSARIGLKNEPVRKGRACMKDYMIERVNAIADYILETGCTVRSCAAHFKVSKTTVHKDMRERLKKLSPARAEAVSRVLDGNREERHIRGGNATREKYLHHRTDENNFP